MDKEQKIPMHLVYTRTSFKGIGSYAILPDG